MMNQAITGLGGLAKKMARDLGIPADGVIDSLDAALLLQHDAGLLPEFVPAA